MPFIALGGTTTSGGIRKKKSYAPTFRLGGLSDSGSDTSQERTVPERFDLNAIVGGATSTGLQAFEMLGQAPGRVAEMPLSALSTVSKKTTGFDPIQWLEDTVGDVPVLGDVVGRGWDVLGSGPTMVGALLNQRTARLLREHANDADDTPLNPLESFMQGGLPWDVTSVGELRQDALARGFTAEDMTALANGSKSDFDFGDRRINQNEIADIGLRFLLDPTNLLLGTGKAVQATNKLLKLAGIAVRPAESIGMARDLTRAGDIVAKAPDAVTAGAHAVAGNAAASTWQGVGQALLRSGKWMFDPRGYASVGGYYRRATALSAGVTATDLGSDWVEGWSKDTPFEGVVRDVHQLANEIIERRPFSNNSAFLLMSAFKYPFREIAGETVQGVRSGQLNLMGRQTETRFAAAFGKKSIKDWYAYMGGREMAHQSIEQAADSLVRKRYAVINDKAADSIAEPAIRFNDLATSVRGARDWMFRKNNPYLSDDRLLQELRQMHGVNDFNAGTTYTPDPNGNIIRSVKGESVRYRRSVKPLEKPDVQPVQTYFDPDVMRDRVVAYYEAAQKVRNVAGGKLVGRVALRLRDVTTKERISNALDELRLAAGNDGVIEGEVVRAVLNRNRPLMAMDRSLNDWQLKATKVTVAEAEAKLSKLMEDAPSLGEYLAELGKREQMAPESVGMSGQAEMPWAETGTTINEELIGDLPIKSLGDDVTPAQVAALRDVEADLANNFPEYTLSPAPKDLVLPPAETTIGQVLRQQTLLGEMLHNAHGLGSVTRMLEWMVRAEPGNKLAQFSKQATFEEFKKLGIDVKDAERIQAEIAQHMSDSFISRHVSQFRSPTSLWHNSIEKIARRVLAEKSEAIPEGAIWRAMDRANSRYWRTLQDTAKKGGVKGQLGRVLNAVYGAGQAGAIGATGHYLKSLYPLFRFMADPRWWLMNKFEADILRSARDGAPVRRLPGEPEVSPATYAHATGTQPTIENLSAASAPMAYVLSPEDAQQLLRKDLQKFFSSSFESSRLPKAEELVNYLWDRDSNLKALRQRFGWNDKRTLAQALDEQLYSFDMKGVKKTVMQVANEELSHAEVVAMRPLLEKLWDRNQQSYDDIVNMYTGNASRTNLERLANSYWAFWPLSYQLKAGKWLFDLMTDRALGAKTNLAGAATYDRYLQEHKRRMIEDPQYQRVFEENPTLWLAAQMLVPITPGDLGVSLSRIPRYLGAEFGWWAKYQANKDPITLITKIGDMGPVYSFELLQRANQDQMTKDLWRTLQEARENLLPSK